MNYLYAIIYHGNSLSRVGTIRFSRTIGGVQYYNIYLEGWFLDNPLIDKSTDDNFMGETSNIDLWFRMRSFGKVEVHPI